MTSVGDERAVFFRLCKIFIAVSSKMFASNFASKTHCELNLTINSLPGSILKRPTIYDAIEC